MPRRGRELRHDAIARQLDALPDTAREGDEHTEQKGTGGGRRQRRTLGGERTDGRDERLGDGDATERPGDGAEPAHDRHAEQHDALLGGEAAEPDALLQDGVERAGHAGEYAGDDHAHQADPRDGHRHGGRGLRVVAAGQQDAARATPAQRPHDDDGEDEQADAQVVHRRLGVQMGSA